jgi:hypothetical protein
MKILQRMDTSSRDRLAPFTSIFLQRKSEHLDQDILVNKIVLKHAYMKIKQVFTRMIMLASSESRKIIIPFIYSRDNIWKTRNKGEIKRSKPLSQDFFHFRPVESPIDSLNMESPGE